MFLMDLPAPETFNTRIVEERQIQTNSKYQLIFSKSKILAHIQRLSKPDEKPPAYEEIPFTQEEKEKLDYVITAVGMHNKTTLLVNRELFNKIMKIKAEIEHIHPLRSLGYILNKPDLRNNLKAIFMDFWKKKEYVYNFSLQMEIRNAKNDLNIYIYDFAKEIHVKPETIIPFFEKKDWKGFLETLIQQ